MKAIEIENELREVVSRLITEVDLSTKQGRQDINLISEDAWIPILKEVYQCPNLINLNKKQRNFPGIDLGDEQDRVAFQVTASTNLQKVKKTLSQFRDKNYKNSFDELYIFTITTKQSSYSQDAIDKEAQDEFSFSAKTNIIDPGNILEKITSLRLAAQERLLNEFKVILGDVQDKLAEQDSNKEIPLKLISNLVKIEYPNHVFVAELDLDESFILQMAEERLDYKKKKRKKVSTSTLVRLMLATTSNPCQGWVIQENKIFTFLDLNSHSEFFSVIDIGSVEKIESEFFFENELIEYRNLFVWLLKNTTKDTLERFRVDYRRKDKMFYFLPRHESEAQRKEQWTGQKKATRTVYEVKYQKKEPSKVAYHKHLAFDLSFINFGYDFYCAINPSWIYTFDLYQKSYFHQDLLSKQKKLEFNQSVRNHVLFLAYFLSNLDSDDDIDLRFLNSVAQECIGISSLSAESCEISSQENSDEN